MKKRAVVTISALNYAARVEVLARTFAKFHPDIPFHFFVVDDPSGARSKKLLKTKTKLSFMNDLVRHHEKRSRQVPFMSMMFPYDVMEASTAVKPFVLMHLLEEMGYDEVLFIDPDAMIVSKLDSVWSAFRDADVLLTPHLVTLGDFDKTFLNERTAALYGIFNLGFIGVANTPKVKEFLSWWGQRLVRHCVKNVAQGLFTDQRWIDVAFGGLSNAAVLRDPGLNVAHWNMCERDVWRDKSGRYKVGKETLKFFHFSGYQPKHPKLLSVHRPDLKLDDLGAVKDLAREYHQLLLKNGHAAIEKADYGYRKFSNGVEIPQVVRDWSKRYDVLDQFNNPFDAREHRSLFDWLLDSLGTDLCPLASIIKVMRPELQSRFPDGDARANGLYMKWLLERGATEHALDPRLSKLLGKKMPAYEGLIV